MDVFECFEDFLIDVFWWLFEVVVSMEYDVLVICFVEFFGVLDYFFFVCFDFCFFFSVEVDVVWGVSG